MFFYKVEFGFFSFLNVYHAFLDMLHRLATYLLLYPVISVLSIVKDSY